MYQQGHGDRKISYPVRFTYINKINNWWPPEKIATDLGVPGFSNFHMYNFIALSFWTYQHGPVDLALLWDDPMKYFGDQNPFGSNKQQVQKTIKQKYNHEGIKIMVSAFGATEMPTTQGIDPVACAQKLGQFVINNNLDGVDIDWEDNHAMEAGKGQQWLITFTQRLRTILPSHIITHAPQAPYFCAERYTNGAYVNIHKQVGNLIDFYNVQFYNQGNNRYDTYETLFVCSGSNFPGTSVKQICQRGVPLEKIIVGKPVNPGDATNTGYTDKGVLSNAFVRAFQEGRWHGGVMFWQFSSDIGGETVKASISRLKELYGGNQ